MPKVFFLWPQQQKLQLLFKFVLQCFGLCTVHYVICYHCPREILQRRPYSAVIWATKVCRDLIQITVKE